MRVQYQLVDVETKMAIRIGDEFNIADFMKSDFGKEGVMSWDEAAILFGDPLTEPPAGTIYYMPPIKVTRKAIL